MSKRLVLENEFAHLWFHPGACIAHHPLRKFIWGERYQLILNDGLDLSICSFEKAPPNGCRKIATTPCTRAPTPNGP